jgi:general transcription factor 3C polypeptide 3 (transcription factor C subunit 4)
LNYRGVPFNEWLDLFLEYATGLAHCGKSQEGIQICQAAADANVFVNSKEDMFLIYLTMAGKLTLRPIGAQCLTTAACAIRGKNEEICVYVARFLMSQKGHQTDAFRMFAALSRLCPSPASWYASGPNQKFLLRQIRAMDKSLKPEAFRDAPAADEDDAADSRASTYPYPSKELDTTLLMIYGHVLFTSDSFNYALSEPDHFYS